MNARYYQRLGPAIRRAQFRAAGVEIARESGLFAVTADAVSHRVGCHVNLVRRYMGNRLMLATAIANEAYRVQAYDVVREARRLGLIQ